MQHLCARGNWKQAVYLQVSNVLNYTHTHITWTTLQSLLIPILLSWEWSAVTISDLSPSDSHRESWLLKQRFKQSCFPSLSKFWFTRTQWCRKQKVQLWSLMESLFWTVTLVQRPHVPHFLAVPYSLLYCWRDETDFPSESSCPGQTSPSSNAAYFSCIFPGCPKSLVCRRGKLCRATRCGSGTTGSHLIPNRTAQNRHNQTVKNQSKHSLILTLKAW